MEIRISNKLKDKIEKNFKDKKELKNGLLSGNADIISKIGVLAQKGIDPKEIVKSYENDEMEKLYKKANKMIEIQDIYNELCYAIAKTNLEEEI